MKGALIKVFGSNVGLSDESYKYVVDRLCDVTNLVSLNDMRKNYDCEYGIPCDSTVKVGMLYNPETNIISDTDGNQVFPPKSATEEINTLNDIINELTYNVDENSLSLDDLKEYLIKKNKKNLEQYLYDHPMIVNTAEGKTKTYTITEDKQNQLTGVLNAYTYAKAIGVDIPLTWNETNGLCEPYTFEALVGLYLQMLNTVKPIVTYQQEQEIKIREALTKEEVQAIDIDFSDYKPATKVTDSSTTDETKTSETESTEDTTNEETKTE